MAEKGEGSIDDPHIHYYDSVISKSVIDKCRDGDVEYHNGMKIEYGFMGRGVVGFIKTTAVKDKENMTKTIQIKQHFYEDDEECGGDYASVDVLIDGVVVESYGDSYHENGNERALGFVDAIKWLNPDLEIKAKAFINDFTG